MSDEQRSPQVSNQKQELLSSVSEVLAQSGSAGISMSELAKRIGVSRPSLYYHFTDRVDIMSKLVEDITTDVDLLMKSLETREYASPIERLSDLCRERALLIFRKKYNFQLLVRRDESLPKRVVEARKALKKRVFLYHRGVVEQGCVAGVFSVRNPTVATHGIIGMINWSAWWYDEREWDAETLADQLAAMCLETVSASDREELSADPALSIPEIFEDIETSLAMLRDAVSKS